ncbi:uncharacterized protein PFL1_06257 [Pseudozyma flocculosa PF-1]|uniref:SH3 domain-containing protein n=2 Tax=Pseudozyma flocculosa TaxID=84751 RepID=A0A5C3F9G7_9BASI|nr:uncharacterized protein PFL1_06257 [Pseudozyma flocculosa PF-1]EPQ26322.1 hypothetical protein PFL1_06257 [Pseudozyma flocculosa PF-1]SPO40285.1 uncharacterized protein PSFLO_05767 [Pseudozyma flocculosa]
MAPVTFPYLARATIKYKSPHKQDLTFAKGETIRVTGIAPKADEGGGDDDDDDDDDWLVGESLDGSRKGTFPGGFVESSDEQDQQEVEASAGVSNLAPAAASTQPVAATETAEPAERAPVVPQAARDAALEGKTETAGFGAPLPPRPAQSDDEDDGEEQEQPKQQAQERAQDAPGQSPHSSAAIAEPATQPAATESQPAEEAPVAASIAKATEPELKASAAAPAPATAPARQAPTSSESATSAKSPTAAGATSPPPVASRSPPPITTKPAGMSSSFRDRLAAFNKPADAAAPPPLPRGKPGGWKRPPPAADAPKPVLPGQPAAAASSATKAEPQAATAATAAAATAPAAEPVRSKDESGFSAADAQSSIKMSLKERMAALQRGDAARSAGGGDDDHGATSPTPKPAPAPGRIAAEKRNAALAGMGLAPAPPQPARSLSRDSAKSGVSGGGGEDEAAHKEPVEEAAAAPSAEAEIAESAEASAADEAGAEAAVADDAPELTEEEQEAQRRAALAKRMAALGGRRMGGGPALFGAPAPAGAPVKKASTSSASDQGTSVEPGIAEPRQDPTALRSPSINEADGNPLSPSSDASAAEPAAPLEDGQPKTLAVPRRAAPPRRKRPVAAATASPSSAAAEEATSPAADVPSEAASGKDGENDEGVPSSIPVREASTGEPADEAADEEGHGLATSAGVGAAIAAGDTAAAAGEAATHRAGAEHDEEAADSEGPSSTIEAAPSHLTEAPGDSAAEEAPLDRSEPTGATTLDADRDADEISTAAVTPSGYESEDARIKEHERQLEEYLQGGTANKDDELERMTSAIEPDEAEAREQEDVVPADDPIASPVDAGSARHDTSTPKPPSRPPSTRPPVPRTSLPPAPIDTAGTHDHAAASNVRSPLSPGRESAASPAPGSASSAQRRSFVPPVPRASVPPPPREAGGVASPPPLPRSPPPLTPGPVAPSLGSVAADATDEQPGDAAAAVPPAPILAAPRPRMAMPTEDPEDEELLQAADAAQQGARQDEAEASAPKQNDEPVTATADEDEAQEEPVELTEEEQEAQRRANLANRMARLGGQRIGGLPGMAPPPIMGAPMPPRRKPTPAAAEDEPRSDLQGTGAGNVDALEASVEPHGHSAYASEEQPAAGVAAAATDAPVRLASPPPVPTSPPPKPLSPAPNRPLPPRGGELGASSPPPLPVGRPSSTAPIGSLDEAAASLARASTPGSTAGTADSLARRTSMRPAIPQGLRSPPVRSREPSQIESHPAAATGEDDAAHDEEEPVPRVMAVSPPALPLSPPPRPSSRVPPLPGQVAVPSRDASYQQPAVASPTQQAPVDYQQQQQQQQQQPSQPQFQQEAVAHGATPSQGSSLSTRQSSRDLDLMPSSRWWRHGLSPLRLPPTVAGRPDAILYADTSSGTERGKATHSADIYVLFEDYSTTTISLSFQDDDAEESATTLTQVHNFPPPKPVAEQLRAWSSEVGAQIAKAAIDAAKHPPSTPVGDGSARSFAVSLITALPSALPPVGSSYGALILTQVGATVMETGADEPRPGDVAVCVGAELKGKRGLAPYHASYGSAADPLVAVVVECEAKKNKLRCVVQSGRSAGKGSKGIDEVSLRLDDLKSGVIKVFRVAKRQAWVEW